MRILPSLPPGYVPPVTMHARVGTGYPSLPLHEATCWLVILLMFLTNVNQGYSCLQREGNKKHEERASVHVHIFMRGCICGYFV